MNSNLYLTQDRVQVCTKFNVLNALNHLFIVKYFLLDAGVQNASLYFLRAVRVELTLTAWKADHLPLMDARIQNEILVPRKKNYLKERVRIIF